MNNFEILSKDKNSSARRGLLTTAHGKVQTPAFCPIGSAGAVKGITPQLLKETGAEIILANTYHLLLRPGIEAIEKLGGIHKFMAWPGPILTDSGGYQVFSLGDAPEKRRKIATTPNPPAKIDNDGVEFTSHIDGAKIYLNAEIATQFQNRLGADIIMCLDQPAPFPCRDSLLKQAVERTIRWAKRCKKAHNNQNQLLFGITQGGINPSLREYCTSELVKLDFDGYAIGGLSVGEGHENMIKTTRLSTALLPEDKPRYLMGVGMPADIIAAVAAGADLFDCVLPTRNGRNAFAFTEAGPVHLRNNAYIQDSQPIETGCDCYCCRTYSRATLRHFFNAGEMLGPIMTSLHNLRFYQKLLARTRQAIKQNKFADWATEQIKNDY